MKKTKLSKLLLCSLVFVTVAGLCPAKANAEWRLNSTGWWYSKGSSWSVGWDKIDGKWYHFNGNGYMETGWINDGGKKYLLDSDGAMVSGNMVYKFKSSGELISSEPYIENDKKQKQAEIKLDGNPTTGCEWQYTIADKSIVKMDSDNYHSDAPDAPDDEDVECGTGGTYSWKFSGLKMGTTEINFKYLQPWYPDKIYEAKTYICTVDKDLNILLEEKQ